MQATGVVRTRVYTSVEMLGATDLHEISRIEIRVLSPAVRRSCEMSEHRCFFAQGISTPVACSDGRHCLHILPLQYPVLLVAVKLYATTPETFQLARLPYYRISLCHAFCSAKDSTRIVVVRFPLPSNWREPALRSMCPIVVGRIERGATSSPSSPDRFKLQLFST